MQILDVKNYLLGLQQRIVTTLSAYEDDKQFLPDSWTHGGGGGGQFLRTGGRGGV